MGIKKILTIISVALAGLASSSLVFAADMGSAIKADTLLAEPFNDAKSVGNMARGDSVEIMSKKGAWLQIKTKKTTGWVRLLSVKRAASTTSNGKSILDVASGRAGTGQVVSTTGIRGLSAEELKSAKFNEEEIKSMESYSQSATQAQNFASAGQLQAAKMPYFVNNPNTNKGN